MAIPCHDCRDQKPCGHELCIDGFLGCAHCWMRKAIIVFNGVPTCRPCMESPKTTTTGVRA